MIVATGGLSLPGTGSDGTGIEIVRRLGHTIHETYPALTPLTLEPPRYAPLAGISRTVTIRAPLFVPPDVDEAAFEAKRLELEQSLNAPVRV